LTEDAALDVDEALASAKSTKADWLNLAIEALINEGIDQVKVQVMARKLGVSRSSFYWFFDSIQDLQDQLLSHWLTRNTGPIIERAMRPANTVVRAVCNVFECWVDPDLFDPNLDIAIRYWGRRDAAVRSVVDQADTQRVEALTKMFMRYDYPEEEAFTRARVLYLTQIGHYALEVQDTPEVRMSHLRSYLLTFTGNEPDPRDMEAFKRLADEVAARESQD
jgi:AcrR family transcriptional regulator